MILFRIYISPMMLFSFMTRMENYAPTSLYGVISLIDLYITAIPIAITTR